MPFNYPLPDNYFPPVDISPHQEIEWIDLMNDVLQKTTTEEIPYYESGYKHIDGTLWELAKSEHEFHAYIPTENSPLYARMNFKNQAISICMGTALGRVEDLISGLRTADNQEANLFCKFMGFWLDCKVLADLNIGQLSCQTENQISTLQLKWRVVRTPAGKLVRDRDIVLLEHMGMATDVQGRPYGFLIIHSVNIPEIPELPAEYNTVRMGNKVMYIFRQVTADRMGVFVRGETQMDGKIKKFLQKKTWQGIGFGILTKGIEFAEAKKLTVLALHKSPILRDFQKGRNQRSQSNDDILRAKAVTCSICEKKKGAFSRLRLFLSKAKLSQCLVCGNNVCGPCSVEKPLVATTKILRVNCCKHCIVRAQRVNLNPQATQLLTQSTTTTEKSSLESNRSRAPSGRSVCGSDSSSRSEYNMPFETIPEKDWMAGLNRTSNVPIMSTSGLVYEEKSNAKDNEHFTNTTPN